MIKTCFTSERKCPLCGSALKTNVLEYWCDCGFEQKRIRRKEGKRPVKFNYRTAHDIQENER